MNLKNEGGSFYVVSDSLSKYANMAEAHISDGNGQGGNDHFISTIKAISDLWRRYSAGEVKNLIREIKSSHSLISWFSMIVCMILYARDGNNQLSVCSMSVDEIPFFRIWKITGVAKIERTHG